MCDVYYQTINNTQIIILHPLHHFPYNTINIKRLNPLAPFTANAARELDVLGHDGDALGVDGAEVGVFKQTDKICLRCMLQSKDSG